MDIDKHDKICEAYWNIHDEIQTDPEYARMRSELEALTAQYDAVLKSLSVKNRELLERCILLRESMNSRMLEWACGKMLFP